MMKCENCIQLEREIERLKADYEELREGRKLDAENVDSALQKVEKAEAQLAALEAKQADITCAIATCCSSGQIAAMQCYVGILTEQRNAPKGSPHVR